MEIKIITYQRVLNLGNYESKRLEMTADVLGQDPEMVTTNLMEMVERKLQEDAHKAAEAELADLRRHRGELRKQIAELQKELGQLQQGAAANPAESEPSIDDIPFDAGDTASGGIPDGF